MRLRTRLVLWQGPTAVRVGADPRWAVVLADLSPSAARALATLPRGADDERAIRSALRREAVPDDEASAVLAHLGAARLLVPSPVPDGPDARTWGLLESDGDAAPVLERRRAARVRVVGLGRLGAGLAATLARAGVGRLDLVDDSPVSRHDVGWAGVTLRDVGAPRAGALARALHDVAPAVLTPAGGAEQEPDLVVLVEQHVADPTRHRPLMTAGTPHLSVVVREASVLVGPLVRPGVTACLRCLDHHRADVDPAWPAVAAQLAARPPEPDETVLAAVAGPLAAAQALAALDGRRATVEDATLELALPDAVPRFATRVPHPACGCTGLPA